MSPAKIRIIQFITDCNSVILFEGCKQSARHQQAHDSRRLLPKVSAKLRIIFLIRELLSGVNQRHLLPGVEFSDNSCRDASNKTVTGERAGYDRTRRDRNVVAQRHTPENYSSCTYPTVVADGDRLCVRFTEIGSRIMVEVRIVSVVPVNRMRRRVYLHPGRDKDIVADTDCIAVDESAAIVDRHIVAQIDITTESADKPIAGGTVLADMPEQLFQH